VDQASRKLVAIGLKVDRGSFRAVRRLYIVGGGAPFNFGPMWRRAAGLKNLWRRGAA